MSIAFFDLDNTLIAGDSDYLWGCYLVEIGAVDRELHQRRNEDFMRDYQRGCLDIGAYLEFALAPLRSTDPDTLHRWRHRFVETRIEPLILPKARRLLDQHRHAGHPIVIVTSTNAFVTEPIGRLLGADALLATQPERREGTYTGSWTGVPCSGEGKVAHVNEWLEQSGEALGESWFYTDSIQDLPLLEVVEHAVAVDPDERLAAISSERGWPIISLR